MSSSGYLVYNGHKIPFRYSALRNGVIEMTFSITLPGKVVWPEDDMLGVYDGDDRLVFVYPGKMPEMTTRSATYSAILSIDVQELRVPPQVEPGVWKK